MEEGKEDFEQLLTSNDKLRAGELEKVYNYCDSLPLDKNYVVSIYPEEENRRNKQNRLMWAWNNEAGNAQGWDANYQHGVWKHDLLLPLMKGSKKHGERAARLQETLDYLPTRDLKVFYSFDSIRSSDLTVKQFAKALTKYRDYYAANGIILRSRDDLIVDAIGEEMASRG